MVLVTDPEQAFRFDTIGMAGLAAEQWFNATSKGEQYTIEIDPRGRHKVVLGTYCVRVKEPEGFTVGYLAVAHGQNVAASSGGGAGRANRGTRR
jgi:hypothetical protein